MTVTVLDANILIAAMDTHDAHHAAAAAYLKRAVAVDQLHVPTLNLAEVLVGQVRQGRGAPAEAAIKALGVGVVSSDSLGALELATLRANTGLKLPDCVVLACALKLDAALATTDKVLAREATKLGLALALPVNTTEPPGSPVPAAPAADAASATTGEARTA